LSSAACSALATQRPLPRVNQSAQGCNSSQSFLCLTQKDASPLLLDPNCPPIRPVCISVLQDSCSYRTDKVNLTVIVASTGSPYSSPTPHPKPPLQFSTLRREYIQTVKGCNSFPCHTSAKSARNPFPCHTYDFALLQVLTLPHIQKTGGCPSFKWHSHFWLCASSGSLPHRFFASQPHLFRSF